MTAPGTSALFAECELTATQFARITRLLHDHAGIRMREGKEGLVRARLTKRLRKLGLPDFDAYLTFVEQEPSRQEFAEMIDALTTNKTSFLREATHFDFLRDAVFPHLDGPVRIWSAGCSSGEEPYTLAMVLGEALPEPEAARVRLLASDLSTKVLATGRAGVYKLERLRDVDPALLRKYFEKGLGAQEGLARVKAHVRQRIRFEQLNLLEIGDLGTRFSVIFCRNVMIYFDRPVQQRVVSMLERHLLPGGYLFISHSESLNGISHDLRWMAPAVYRRRDA